MYYYCSAPGCGNRIEYQVSKPTSCPKCKTVFADLSKTIAKAKPLPEIGTKASVKRREVEEDNLEDLENEEMGDDSRSLTEQMSESKKAILKRARARKLAERGEVDEEDDEIKDNDQSDDYDEEDNQSKSKVKRLAQQLAASINPSSIKIIGGDEEDGPNRITFRKWCAEKE